MIKESNVNKKGAPPGLLVLCILTILGSVFIVVRSIVTYSLWDLENKDVQHLITVLFCIKWTSCVGSSVAAILMMQLKDSGYKLYLFSSILYAFGILVLVALVVFIPVIGLFGIFQLLFLIPTIAFIVFYSMNRKYLVN